MSSAVRKFYNMHADSLTVLAINTLRLFEVPVIEGILDDMTWCARTRNRELVVYLACTPTPIPFSQRFNQLDVVSIGVEGCITPEVDGSIPMVFMCIALVAPKGNREWDQVGTNWRYHVELSPEQVGWLQERPIGELEAHERLKRSIIRSRNV
jgi:hypothetical protein